MESVGLEGLNKMLVGFSDKGAAAYCNIAYTTGPDVEPILFEGRVEVRDHARPEGFGSDLTVYDSWMRRAMVSTMSATFML